MSQIYIMLKEFMFKLSAKILNVAKIAVLI